MMRRVDATPQVSLVPRHGLRCASVLMLLLLAPPLAALPDVPAEDRIPEQFRHDILAIYAQVKLGPLPVAPRGTATTLAYSQLGDKEGQYRTERNIWLEDGVSVGDKPRPAPGFIDVPHLGGDRRPEVFLGRGLVDQRTA